MLPSLACLKTFLTEFLWWVYVGSKVFEWLVGFGWKICGFWFRLMGYTKIGVNGLDGWKLILFGCLFLELILDWFGWKFCVNWWSFDGDMWGLRLRKNGGLEREVGWERFLCGLNGKKMKNWCLWEGKVAHGRAPWRRGPCGPCCSGWAIFSKKSRTPTRIEAWAVRLFLVLWVKNFSSFLYHIGHVPTKQVKTTQNKRKQSGKNRWVASHEALFSRH